MESKLIDALTEVGDVLGVPRYELVQFVHANYDASIADDLLLPIVHAVCEAGSQCGRSKVDMLVGATIVARDTTLYLIDTSIAPKLVGLLEESGRIRYRAQVDSFALLIIDTSLRSPNDISEALAIEIALSRIASGLVELLGSYAKEVG